MARKKQPTALQQEYLKQVKRITRAASKLAKEGYDLDLEAILGPTPKRVTKSRITKLKAIKPKTLLNEAIYKPAAGSFNVTTLNLPETPEYAEARTQAEEQRKQEEAKKAGSQSVEPTAQNPTPAPEPAESGYTENMEAWAVINGFKDRLFNLPEKFHSIILSFLDEMIKQTSAEDVASALNDMPEDLRDFLSRVGSQFDFEGFSTSFISYLPVNKGIRDDLEDRAAEMWETEFLALPEELR